MIKNNIICCTFQNLKVNEVNSVNSQQNPGCISIKECSQFSVLKCIFSKCFGISDDNIFSNVFTCESTGQSNIKLTSSEYCSNSTTITSDSVFHFSNTSVSSSFCNFSHCKGNHGSSSFTLWKIVQNTKIDYLNNIYSSDVCSLEFVSGEISYCSHCNFVSGSQNLKNIITIKSEVYLDYCSFSNNGDVLLFNDENEDLAHFSNCYSIDSSHSQYSISIVTEIPINSFKIQINPSCKLLLSNIPFSYHTFSLHINILTFIFISL